MRLDNLRASPLVAAAAEARRPTRWWLAYLFGVVVLIVAVLAIVQTLAHALMPSTNTSIVGQIEEGLSFLAIFLALAAWVRFKEGRAVNSLAFRGAGALKLFVLGVALGAAMLSASVLILLALLAGIAQSALAFQGEQRALPAGAATYAVAADDDEALHPEDDLIAVRKAYLTLLFHEVNVRRGHAGTPEFDGMLDTGNDAVNQYLYELTPMMEQRHACFHGSDVVGFRAGWDYLPDFGVQQMVGGEVLACPDVDAGGFWTPPGIADGWWQSPHHFHTLYADPRPNFVACGAYNQVVDKSACETVACITLLPVLEP